MQKRLSDRVADDILTMIKTHFGVDFNNSGHILTIRTNAKSMEKNSTCADGIGSDWVIRNRHS